jgi:tRNA dimethylallyltransferase
MNTLFSPDLPPLALIAGPTASGKSALALRLAEAVNGTIINADASQLYNDLQILSARPSEEDMVRAPHGLFGHVDGATACSAADWATDARIAIGQSREEGRVPILVGGTGLYIRTLLNGIAPIPPIDPAIRAQVRAMPVAESHAVLTAEDPIAAERLRPTDTTRIARALEVIRSTGRPLHHWHAESVGGIGQSVRLVPTILLPPRDWLYARCESRFEAMLEQGAIAEVEALLARKLDPALPVMRAIGVREIAAWLAGEIDRQTMIESAQTATRQYAKRQYTWFSHQPPSDWDRIVTQLDDELTTSLVIKLHNTILTR